MPGSIKVNGNKIQTTDLLTIAGVDITARVQQERLVEGTIQLLEVIRDYCKRGEVKLTPGESIQYGFWGLRLIQTDDPLMLECRALAPNGRDIQECVDPAIIYWNDQHRLCELAKTPFEPPSFFSLTSLDDGVVNGRAIRGIRYKPIGAMSGWWLTSDVYDGTNARMRNEHTSHLADICPSIIQFLALPVGYCFYSSRANSQYWFDEEVAREEP